MATVFSRRDDNSIAHACLHALNQQNDASAVAGGKFHRDVTSKSDPNGNYYQSPIGVVLNVTAANASDLPSSVALHNNLMAVMRAHFGDDSAHLIAGPSQVASLDGYGQLPSGAALPAVQTGLNAMKLLLNAHLPLTSQHLSADSTNTVSAANASDQATSNTLANALKTSLNAHMASAPAGGRIKLIG